MIVDINYNTGMDLSTLSILPSQSSLGCVANKTNAGILIAISYLQNLIKLCFFYIYIYWTLPCIYPRQVPYPYMQLPYLVNMI